MKHYKLGGVVVVLYLLLMSAAYSHPQSQNDSNGNIFVFLGNHDAEDQDWESDVVGEYGIDFTLANSKYRTTRFAMGLLFSSGTADLGKDDQGKQVESDVSVQQLDIGAKGGDWEGSTEFYFGGGISVIQAQIQKNHDLVSGTGRGTGTWLELGIIFDLDLVLLGVKYRHALAKFAIQKTKFNLNGSHIGLIIGTNF